MQRSSYHPQDDRHFEDRTPIQTSDFDFDSIDHRLGWTENDPTATDDDSLDPDKAPIPPQQSGIIKLICLLLASDNIRLELMTMAAAFGLSSLLGGKSFSEMAQEAGCSKQAFSKRVIRCQQAFELPVTRSQKSIAARARYSEIQREVWRRPERKPADDLKLARNFVEPPTPRRQGGVTVAS